MDVILNGNQLTSAPENSKPLTSQGNFELNFLAALGYEINRPPLGDLLRQYYQLEGEWLVVSPITWQATHNDAFIVAANNDLGLSEKEAYAWFKEVEQFLKEENFCMHYHNAYIWLIKTINKPQLNSRPLHLIFNKSLMPFLEEMDTTLYWQRLFTELQMFLSNHKYNQEHLNRPPVNGLWLYGSGQFVLNSKRVVMTNDTQLILAFSQKIKQLELNNLIDKNSILLLKNINQVNIDQLAETIKNFTTSWFWNDIAYQTVKRRWWDKLWRGLVNAN